ncbi:MAG TPA: TonB-dependent receptor [Sulfurivirga caldicuralii]|nr:TonB-dependent receptor [Sulfurivirga caldicuralii]
MRIPIRPHGASLLLPLLLSTTKEFTNMRIPLTTVVAATLLASGTLKAETLDPIVVTANNTAQPLSTVTAPTYVITEEEIAEKGWETVAEVLQHVPGISISHSGGLGKTTNIYLRGLSSNGILFLIDGQMVADPSNTTLAPQIENLPLSNVARIEVVAGPQSGIWGANASGGVIHIITRKAGANHFTVKVGSENTRQFTAHLSKRFQGGDLSVYVASLDTEGFTALKLYGSNGSGDEKDGYQQTDLGFKVGIDADQHHRFELQLDKTAAQAQFDSAFPYDPNSTADANERNLLNKVARYRYAKDALTGTLQIAEYTIDRTSYSAYGPYGSKGNLTTVSAKLGYAYAPSSHIQMAGGNQRIQGNSDAYWHDWVGVTHVHRLGSLSLVEALRYDNYDRFKDATTGKLGIKVPLFGDMHLKANYGTGYNAPSAFQVGYQNTQTLKPEKVEGWDIALSGLGASLTYFDQSIHDQIVFDYTTYDRYRNAQGSRTYKGYVLTYQQGFGDWHINLNHTWLEARNDQGQLLARRPLQEGSLMIDYYGFSRWHLGAVIRRVGDYYDGDGRSGTNLGNYTVVDATVNYGLNRHFTLFAKGINLFNQDYYLATDQNNPPQYGYNTGGFQWRLGLRGKF